MLITTRNGDVLHEPYQALAKHRSSFLTQQDLKERFVFSETPEEYEFWQAILEGAYPTLPQCSIDAIRGTAGINPDMDTDPIVNRFGDDLVEPYQVLAQLRRHYSYGSANTLVEDCFVWSETPEGNKFWDDVDDGLRPELALASLLALELVGAITKAEDRKVLPAIMPVMSTYSQALPEPLQTLARIRLFESPQYAMYKKEAEMAINFAFTWSETDEEQLWIALWVHKSCDPWPEIPSQSKPILAMYEKVVDKPERVDLINYGDGSPLPEPYQALAQLRRKEQNNTGNRIDSSFCIMWTATPEFELWSALAKGAKPELSSRSIQDLKDAGTPVSTKESKTMKFNIKALLATAEKNLKLHKKALADIKTANAGVITLASVEVMMAYYKGEDVKKEDLPKRVTPNDRGYDYESAISLLTHAAGEEIDQADTASKLILSDPVASAQGSKSYIAISNA